MNSLFLECDAVISDCEQYRYLLRRRWNDALPMLVVCMLNPARRPGIFSSPWGHRRIKAVAKSVIAIHRRAKARPRN